MRRHGRGLARPQRGGAQSDINVTPLVDVVLVLLIIFMVMTPLQQKALHLFLPETEAPTPPPVTTTAVQLVVELRADGALALNGEPVQVAQLGERLRGLLPGRGREERVVFFSASAEAPYRALVEAMDEARRAEPGVEVAMATELPTPQP